MLFDDDKLVVILITHVDDLFFGGDKKNAKFNTSVSVIETETKLTLKSGSTSSTVART